MSESISPKPTSKSTAQLVMEGIVDAVAIIVIGLLAYVGKISGDWAGVGILALAGVRIIDLAKNGGSGGGPPATGGTGAGGLAGMVVLLGTALAAAVKHSRVTLATLVIRAVSVAAIAAALIGSSGCYHRDGRAFTGPEYTAAARQVWKFTLAEVRDLCDLVRTAGPAVSVLLQGSAVPIAVAHTACDLVDLALPRAAGVVVLADGSGHVHYPL